MKTTGHENYGFILEINKLPPLHNIKWKDSAIPPPKL
jgi:hypothetical protein